MENVLAKLVVVHGILTEIASTFPEAGVALDRAMADIDLAARIIEGSLDLSACEDCGCTVEDGECECKDEWPDGALEVSYGSDHSIGEGCYGCPDDVYRSGCNCNP